MADTTSNYRTGAVQVAAFAALVVAHAPAWADEADAINFGVSQTVTRDDNLYRLADGEEPEGGERGDTISVTAVTAAFDRVYSRQRLQADLAVRHSAYAVHDGLDYSAPSLRLAWDWQLGNHWTGALSHSYSEAMTDFDDTAGSNQTISRNVRTAASANYWIHPDWAVGVGASRLSYTYLDNASPESELDSRDVDVNVTYRPSSGNRVVFTARQTVGRYPNRADITGSIRDYQQRDVRVSGDWRLTGALRLSGYFGVTDRSYDSAPNRDFQGYTGRLALQWVPTAKTAVTLSWRREIGAEEDLAANYAVTRVVSIAPTWAISDKLRLGGIFDVRTRDYGGDPELGYDGLVDAGDYRTTTYGFNLSYQAMRALSLSVGLNRSRRSSAVAASEYRATSIWLSGKFAF